MPTPSVVFAAVSPRAVSADRAIVPARRAHLARQVLVYAALLGIAADALLRAGITGVALPLWVGLAALTLAALARSAGRRLTREVAGWLAAAVAFAITVCWRSAELLQVAGVFTTIGCLLMATIAFARPDAALHADRVRDLLWAALTRGMTVAAGFFPLASREAVIPGESDVGGRRTGALVRAALIAVVLVLVFGALLRGADPIFASLLTLSDIDFGALPSHVVMIGLFAWLASGWARAALDQRSGAGVPTVFGITLGRLEITAALGTLDVLFALFMLTQLGWLFGGEHFLQARTGLTAAEYARGGFFQMVLVVLLVVPILLVTRALLPCGDALARRHTMLAMPLIALLGAMIVSAALRMRLYVHYYGLTTDRFYPMVFMIWLGIVLAWMAWTVLRDRGERFVAGVLLSGLATLALLNIVSPDRIVARVNIARATQAASRDAAHLLDLSYLARLSGEAAPLAMDAVIAAHIPRAGANEKVAALQERDRCSAAETLLVRWGSGSRLAVEEEQDGAWRSWNAGERAARRAIRSRARELRAVQRVACLAARAIAASKARQH